MAEETEVEETPDEELSAEDQVTERTKVVYPEGSLPGTRVPPTDEEVLGKSESEDEPPEETEAQVEVLAAEEPVEDEGVPDGTISEVKAWVGDDLSRAEAALADEMEKDPPRVTLVTYLEDLLRTE